MKQYDLHALYRMHYKYLLSFANQYVQDFHLAEDLVQDTFLLYWEQSTEGISTQRLQDESFEENSLYSLTKNRLLHILCQFIKSSKKSDIPIPVIAKTDTTPIGSFFSLLEAPVSQTSSKYEYSLLRFCLPYLSSCDQKILYLYFFEKKNAKEISHILSITHTAARKRLERSKKRLQKLYISFL